MGEDKIVLLDNYRRVRLEEYASATVFGPGMVIFGYATYHKLQHDGAAFSTIVYCLFATGCVSLASSSFQQGRVMSKEVSRLERELADSLFG